MSQPIKDFKLTIHFTRQEDIDAFAQLIGQPVAKQTPYIWYPKEAEINEPMAGLFGSDDAG